MNKVAVVVPVYNRREITLNYISSFLEISSTVNGCDFTIVIIDDGSTDGTSQSIRQLYSDVVILSGDGNLWWTGAIRKGVEYAIGQDFDLLLIMNDDVEMAPDFLEQLLAVHEKNISALLSSIKLNKQEDGSEQIIAAGFNVVGWLKQDKIVYADEKYTDSIPDIIECDILTGSSLLIPINVVRDIGNFDSKKFPHHWGDFEFTRRASLAGYKCLVVTKSKIYTEYNPNYALPYMLKSSRVEYLKNLFNNTRHFYGFRSIMRSSFMHKGFFRGLVLFTRRFFGLLKLIFLKVVLTNHALKRLFQH